MARQSRAAATRTSIKDIRAAYAELQDKLDAAEGAVVDLTAANEEKARTIGRLEANNEAWKKAHEKSTGKIATLRDACAVLDQQLAEIRGYATALVENVERAEGVLEVYPRPARRQIPGLGRLPDSKPAAGYGGGYPHSLERQSIAWWKE